MDAHAEKIHSIMNLILNKPSLFIFTMLFDFFSALFSTISSVRLAIFTQNVIEGKYIEAIQVELVNLILILIAVFADYLYHVLQNKTIQSGMIVYRDMISNSLVHTDKDENLYISALNTDSTRIENGIRNAFVVCDGLMYMIVSLVALIYIHWSIMFVSIGLFLLNYIVPILEKKPSERAEKQSSYLQKEYLEKTTDVIKGKVVWNAYNCFSMLRSKLSLFANEYERDLLTVRNKQSLLNEVPIAVSVTGQTLLMVFTLFLIIKGAVIPGTILSVGNLSGSFFNNISNFMSAKNQMNGYNAVFRERIEYDEKPVISEKKIDDYSIRMKNVSFSYEHNSELIHDFNYVFESGKKYLIYGDSGCGKSTLLKLIFRSLVENKGDIFLGKENYSNISDEQLHRIIGFIMQDSYVFDDTVLNNITLGRNLGEGVVQDALLQAKAQDVSTLNGNAKELSGGQMQRICLARELVEYHPIILMDEVANAVDEETAKQIYELLLNSNRTVIAVAHYLPAGIKEKFDEILPFSAEN